MRLIHHGITIIELLVVFFIIGLLVAAATPSATRMYQENRLTRRANEIVAYFREARQSAVTEQTTYGLKVFASTNLFQLIHLIPDVENPGQFLEEQVSEFTVEEPLSVTSSSLTEGELLTFNAVGNPNKAAAVVVEDNYERQRAICINAVGSIQLIIGDQC